jgi:hypothetical protein
MLLTKKTGKEFYWKYWDGTHVLWLGAPDANWWKFDVDATDDGFFEMLNVPPEGRPDGFGPVKQFNNVWNRKDLFIHASFVTSSAQGYLGRGGEFYTQPNKIYYADFPTNQFYVEVSFDGYHPVPLPYENWIVELVFMIDEEDHVGS